MSTSTAIIIVNWNGWSDTIECLEAAFRMEGFAGPVVVCDNGSTDGSVDKIAAWAEGRLCALAETRAPQMTQIVSSPVPKPLSCAVVTDGDRDGARQALGDGCRLLLVEVGKNVGFAAGNNAGLRLLQEIEGISWYWLLNSDTVPAAKAFSAFDFLAGRVDEPVICGSLLLEYWEPGSIQACGAHFNRYLGTVGHHCEGMPVAHLAELPKVVPVSYPVGASLLINDAFLKKNGFMAEEYFLYYEEIDWVLRDGWPSRAFVVRDSLVYHKAGKSTAAGRTPSRRGLMPDYHVIRGRLLVLRKYVRFHHLGVFLTACSVFKRLARPSHRSFGNAVCAVVAGLSGPSRAAWRK